MGELTEAFGNESLGTKKSGVFYYGDVRIATYCFNSKRAFIVVKAPRNVKIWLFHSGSCKDSVFSDSPWFLICSFEGKNHAEKRFSL